MPILSKIHLPKMLILLKIYVLGVFILKILKSKMFELEILISEVPVIVVFVLSSV